MFYSQANETQDSSAMSNPSEVNQAHPVSFVQDPGRIQVPYYGPVPASHVYSNYPVDPNQAHWYSVAPYGHAPMMNGGQLKNESNMEDGRRVATSYPPSEASLPSTSTMQPGRVYQMVPPISNQYGGGIPSGLSLVHSPIPYPAPYTFGWTTGAEPNTPQLQANAANRVSDGGAGTTALRRNDNSEIGGGASSDRIMLDQQGTASESTPSAASIPSSRAVEDTNGCADDNPSTPTPQPKNIPLMATAGPPQPQPQPPPPHQVTFMPVGPVQYCYPYFSPTGLPHLTSAQHATGSPMYIPHPPTGPIYHHAPLYNSCPTAVFPLQNCVSHATVTTSASRPNWNDEVEDFRQYSQRQYPQQFSSSSSSSSSPASASSSSYTTAITTSSSDVSAMDKRYPYLFFTRTGTGTGPPRTSSIISYKNHKNENENCVDSNFGENTVASSVAPVTASASLIQAASSSPVSLVQADDNNSTRALVEKEESDDSKVSFHELPDQKVKKKEFTDTTSCVNRVPNDVDVQVQVKKISTNVELNDVSEWESDSSNVTTANANANANDGKRFQKDELSDKQRAIIVLKSSSREAANDDRVTSVDISSDAPEESDAKATDIGLTTGEAIVATAATSSSSSSSSSCCSSSVVIASDLANGTTNSSWSATSSSTLDDTTTAKNVSSADVKSLQVVEEQTTTAPSSCKMSWASVAAKSKPSATTNVASLQSTAAARNVASETSNSFVSSSNVVTTCAPQHRVARNTSNKSTYAHSSLNGMPGSVSSSAHKTGKLTAVYKLSSLSLAEDTVLPKIGELMKNYKLDHKAVNIEPRGLENKSNYCYINAILQALLACPPFYNLMKFISTNLHHHKTKLAAKQHLPIIDSVVQFIEEFKLVPQKNRRGQTRKLDATPQEIVPGKPFEPSYMYNMLSVLQNNSSFVMGQQEDAQEFLSCLLNGLNDEMVELIQLADGTYSGANNVRKSQPTAKNVPANKNLHLNNNTSNNNNNNNNNSNSKKISNGDIGSDIALPDDSDSEWKQVHPKIKPYRPNVALTRTPLSDIFRGQMRSVLAKIGDQWTNTIEPFFTLHLNIENVKSVKQALELLPGRDNLEGVTSSRTNQEVDAYQQQYLEELPYVLLLHLKYFDYKHHTCRKIKKSIEFPIDLKLDTKLISPQSLSHSKTASSKSRQYKLFAVVYHDGNEATKGHYLTDVFHIGYGGWVRYDDARVWTVSENDVLKPDLPRVPYLLYYRRCDTIAALMQPPFEKRM